jgi:cytochrome P450 family 12
MILLLSENPEKQEKLRQELKRIMPNPAAPITAEMLNEMKYLRACIKEGMRFCTNTLLKFVKLL